MYRGSEQELIPFTQRRQGAICEGSRVLARVRVVKREGAICFCSKVTGGKSIPVSYFPDPLNLAVLLLLSCLLQIWGGYALTSASNNQGALVEFRTKNPIKSNFGSSSVTWHWANVLSFLSLFHHM